MHSSHVDFSLLGIKRDFVKVSSKNSDLHFASSYLYSIPIPPSRRKAILTELNLQYLTNDLTDLVKIKGALVSQNGKNLKKSLILPLVTRKNRETSDEVKKYQYCDIRSLDQF